MCCVHFAKIARAWIDGCMRKHFAYFHSVQVNAKRKSFPFNFFDDAYQFLGQQHEKQCVPGKSTRIGQKIQKICYSSSTIKLISIKMFSICWDFFTFSLSLTVFIRLVATLAFIQWCSTLSRKSISIFGKLRNRPN